MYGFSDYKFQFHNVGDLGIDFQPSDEDTSGVVRYYGFISYFGSYIIVEEDTTVSTAVTYRYYAGTTGYAVAWSGKTLLSYVVFDQIAAGL